MELVLLAHVGATLFMVGLIWFVQVVHYPLFGSVGREGFAGYSQAHSRLTGFVVGLPMLGRVGSLNASTSLAAVLYAWVLAGRRRPLGPAAGP